MQLFSVIFLALGFHSAHAGGFEIGMAAHDITPPVGVPLGGYGGGDRRLKIPDIFDRYKYSFFFKPSDGVLDPIRAKVMAVRVPGEAPVIFVSLDVVGITAEFQSDLAANLKDVPLVTSGHLVLSATHTHSGPGTLSKNMLWQVIAMDRHVPKVYRAFISGVADTIRDALSSMEPARLLHTSFTAVDLQANRRNKVGQFDPNVQILLARNVHGQILGGIVNYAVHGTFYGTDNHKFSADVAGALERELETFWLPSAGARRPVALFINGAEGDVSPHKQASDKTPEDYAKRFAEQALPALNSAQPLAPSVKIESATVDLGTARFNLRACVKQKLLQKIIFRQFRPFLGSLMAKKTTLTRVTLGDLEMLSWPGEPTTEMGLAVKQAAVATGHPKAMVLGLTQDHLGYFTSPSEYNETTYEACSSMYGENGATKIVNGLGRLLSQ